MFKYPYLSIWQLCHTILVCWSPVAKSISSLSHRCTEQCTVTVTELHICTCARTVWIKDCLSYVHTVHYIYIPALTSMSTLKEKRKNMMEKERKSKGVEAFTWSCACENQIFFWCYFCTLILAHEHMLSYFLCLVAADETEVAFSDGKKGLEVKACDLHKSALYTLVQHTHTHTNFPTLALFCLKACVQYLSLYSSLSSSLPHSVSLFLAHYFFLTSHCLSAAIKITT